VDIDAILKRAPEVVVIDELAHAIRWAQIRKTLSRRRQILSRYRCHRDDEYPAYRESKRHRLFTHQCPCCRTVPMVY
jgi:hypothetical protein